MNLPEIRKLLKEADNGIWGKITVIKRDGKTICREDIGTPRNSNLKQDMFESFVKRTLNINDSSFYECKIISGRKGIYSNWWIEVTLDV